jgi:signal transduction histidine kinase
MDEASAVRARFGALLEAVDEERSRLARHLHDKVAQNLAAVSMHLSMIKGTVRDTKTIEAILECTSLMEDAIRDIRAISYFLHPPLVEELGLNASLKTFAETFTEANGVALELDMDPAAARALSPEVHLAIFRIVQDSARGLASAGAVDIHVVITSTADGVVVTISGRCGPARIEPRESLFWSIVEERAVRHRGQARLAAGESITEIEVMLPFENAIWAVEH